MLKKTIKKIVSVVNNEKGELKAMVWTIGAALVVVAIVLLMINYAPDTIHDLWNAATSHLRRQLGF